MSSSTGTSTWRRASTASSPSRSACSRPSPSGHPTRPPGRNLGRCRERRLRGRTRHRPQALDGLAAVWVGLRRRDVFPAVERDGLTLVDGGIADNAAISQAVALGADRVFVLPTGFALRPRHPTGGPLSPGPNASCPSTTTTTAAPPRS